MNDPQYFRVRKWDDFQHYKHRNPPWIRLHRTLLRDHKFNLLQESEQWQLVRVWLLASETDNHMAYDEKWVRRAIGASRKVPLEKFMSMGFLEFTSEHRASKPPASRKRSAEPDYSDVSDNSGQVELRKIETTDGVLAFRYPTEDVA